MKRGDHLVTPRFGYTHHGIYLGGDEVIHYSGFSEFSKAGSVEKVSLKVFAQEKDVQVKPHPKAKFDPEERIERALSRIGEESYSLVLNNCEHFVNWCIYGQSDSTQVEKAVGGLSAGLWKAGSTVLAAPGAIPVVAIGFAAAAGVKYLARRKK